MGYPYVIDLEDTVGSVTVYSPTIGDIVEIGDDRFFQTLNVFICNTTSYRVWLWDLGYDWNVISDFELFILLFKKIDPEVSKLLFGDLDFSKFELMYKKTGEGENEGEAVLYDKEDEIEINYNVYNHFSQYLRNVFGIFPEEKITNSNVLKQWYIDRDKRDEARREEKAKKEGDEEGQSNSSLQSVISACVNHPGFKYKLKELKDVGVAEFYDSVKRLQIYEQSTALMKGLYSGFLDSSKIKSNDYNFMRDTN